MRVSEQAKLALHLDTNEANQANIPSGGMGTIL